MIYGYICLIIEEVIVKGIMWGNRIGIKNDCLVFGGKEWNKIL